MSDHTKGEVDIVDLVSCHYSTRIKSKRWPLNALAFMLDNILTNTKNILGDDKVSFKKSEFTYQLGANKYPLKA